MELSKYLAKPDQTIEEHVRRLLEQLECLKKYGYINDELLYELIKIACIHHDDGKVNPEFQNRVCYEKNFGKKRKFNSEKEIPHNVLSIYLLNKAIFQCDEDYYKVLFAILYHHDYGDPLDFIGNKRNDEENYKIKQQLIKQLLKEFEIQPIKMRTITCMQKMMMDPEAIKIKGFLHKCDYSASGNYVSEYPNDFLEEALENVKKKWQKINPKSDWNELQRFCIEKRDENVMLIAQTGMGKTEAGLQWIGNHKGYFVLPLRTAINAIYDRVCENMLLNEKIEERVAILHSESLEYYLNQYKEEESLEEYERRGKNLSIPLNISTMDQLFDFVFRYQGYELKLTSFSYSKIVIDEIQMYDPELLAYLIYGLKCITEIGGKVAVMTATLSPFLKTLLKKNINFKEENIKTFTDETLRHHVEIRERKIDPKDIFDFYRKNEECKQRNKILVVCNTIKEAQEIYKKLEELMGNNDKVHLLHSRFIRKERAEKEKEIIQIGKTYGEDGKLDIQSCIWISTSLVEASLDIDFDYLFTELQDLNSLFQRMGRCNRKGQKDTQEPNCFVYTEIDESTLNVSINGFIDSKIFMLSKKAIKEGGGLLTEKRKLDLIETYMTMENLRDSEYYKKYKETINWIEYLPIYEYKKDENRLRNLFTQEIIPSPVYENNKDVILEIEEKLKDMHLNKLERMTLKSKLRQFSVSIPFYQWINYQKSVKSGNADFYPEIQLDCKVKLPVMECLYDKLGFQMMDYNHVIRETEFL